MFDQCTCFFIIQPTPLVVCSDWAVNIDILIENDGLPYVDTCHSVCRCCGIWISSDGALGIWWAMPAWRILAFFVPSRWVIYKFFDMAVYLTTDSSFSKGFSNNEGLFEVSVSDINKWRLQIMIFPYHNDSLKLLFLIVNTFSCNVLQMNIKHNIERKKIIVKKLKNTFYILWTQNKKINTMA